jgi:hypothetical protein
MIRTCLPLAALALLAGCTSENKDKADAPKQVEVAPALPSPIRPKASTAIAVNGEGLHVLLGAGEIARAIPFGADEATVIAIIEKMRGPAKRDRNEECGVGPVQFAHFGSFSLLFQDGKFGGWALQPGEPTSIGTVNGVSIGSDRTILKETFPSTKIDPGSTLDIEFYTDGNEEGGISAFLDGTGPQARITNLWSGLNCVFR